MRWFGPAPFSYACLDTERVSAPIAGCAWCEEPIAEDDAGYVIPRFDEQRIILERGEPTELAYHHECWQRQIIGSVGHINKRCSCYGGCEEDPPGLTRREAARTACIAFENMMRQARKPPPSIEWE